LDSHSRPPAQPAAALVQYPRETTASWDSHKRSGHFLCIEKLIPKQVPVLTAAVLALAGTALTGVNSAGALQPNPHPQLTARRQPVSKLVEEGEKLTERGQVKRALAAYAEAQTLSYLVEIPAGSWNTLCWFGSLWGYAAEVLHACDLAVAKAPDAEDFRDSRGLARALTGNRDGAIADFQAFVNSTKDEFRKSQRLAWINALRRGENPFTPEQLKQLFRE
jgi:tetratricopeptide (TPR) repeat protein